MLDRELEADSVTSRMRPSPEKKPVLPLLLREGSTFPRVDDGVLYVLVCVADCNEDALLAFLRLLGRASYTSTLFSGFELIRSEASGVRLLFDTTVCCSVDPAAERLKFNRVRCEVRPAVSGCLVIREYESVHVSPHTVVTITYHPAHCPRKRASASSV